MSIKEKCGVLAFIPNREVSSNYDYLIDNCSDCELQLLSLLQNKYQLKQKKSEIIIAFSFASALKKLNHRGYDGYGYSLLSEGKLITKVFSGKVSTVELIKSILDKLGGKSLITYLVGHVRYSTNDSYNLLDNQPYQSGVASHDIGICFNGNIDNRDTRDTNSSNLHNGECRYMLNQMKHLELSYSLLNLCTSIKDNVVGAFSTILYDEKSLYAFKDNEGIRPLVYISSKNIDVISSESHIVYGGCFEIDFVKSNDIYKFDFEKKNLARSIECTKSILKYSKPTCEKLCSFESIYFSGEESTIPTGKISNLRIDLGYLLAKNEKLLIDDNFVIGYIPSSAKAYAVGYTRALNKELGNFIKKSNQYERSFIKNLGEIKEALKRKFVIDGGSVKGKKVILIDDSIVRGNTATFISNELRKLGADEVHIRVASPMIKSECNLGVNTKNRELICKEKNIAKLCEELNVDSVSFLEKVELISIIGQNSCRKCFEN